MVNLRALPDLVMWQLLIAVQRRTQQGFRISPDHWDHVARYLRSTGATSLLAVDLNGVRAFEVARLLRHLQREARLAVQTWEDEQRKVVWDLGVIGLPGILDFSEITQPGSRRDAVVDSGGTASPRGPRSTVLCATISVHWQICQRACGCIVMMTAKILPQLGRSDILNYLTRQAIGVDRGDVDRLRMHLRHLRQVKIVLAQCRDAGLTRPGQCMAGLPGEFSIRRTDLPRDPDKRSWRSLPAEVIRALDAATSPARGEAFA